MAGGIQKLLFIDTNIWLDFYRARNEAYLGLLPRLETLSNRIIVTHQLESEYKRNRQSVILRVCLSLRIKCLIRCRVLGCWLPQGNLECLSAILIMRENASRIYRAS
ncbi:PIN-like domain-containing protein [Burkholderia pseudomallei]|uniref:PIN-like domain-containing protein n=1 Tax=Burkholderia pseudomallei TaxID=28450 RepID=UPI0018A2137F|nr:PIN-like domain-containing protein [Burkholderia pseudomallei]